MKIGKLIVISSLCIILIIQTGCWDQKLFEEIGFILQLGIEESPDNSILLSVTYPIVEHNTEEKVQFMSMTSEKLIRTSRERMRNESGKYLQGGKIQQIYFSKDISHKGINEFLEVFFRDPENPLLANVVVVDGSPKEMMEMSTEFKDKPIPAFYVNNLLMDARRRGAVPETRIYDFSIMYYSKTIDPITPLVRYTKKNIEIVGCALFNGDKMVGQLDIEQTIILNALLGEQKDIHYTYYGQTPNKNTGNIKRGASMSIRDIKRKIKIDTSRDVPEINISSNFTALIDEYTLKDNMDKPEIKKTLQDNIASNIKAEMQKLIKYMQGVGSDPIGIGELIRSKHNKYWKGIMWKEVYKHAVFNVDVKVNIESYGTLK